MQQDFRLQRLQRLRVVVGGTLRRGLQCLVLPVTSPDIANEQSEEPPNPKLLNTAHDFVITLSLQPHDIDLRVC